MSTPQDNPTSLAAWWLRERGSQHASQLEDWTYSGDLGDLKHIRYASDWQGYNHPWRRIVRTVRDVVRGIIFGPSELDRMLHVSPRNPPDDVGEHQVGLLPGANMPDGGVGGLICYWMEDGQYVELVQPKVGMLIADWLDAEPDNPHAQAVAAAMIAVLERGGWDAGFMAERGVAIEREATC